MAEEVKKVVVVKAVRVEGVVKAVKAVKEAVVAEVEGAVVLVEVEEGVEVLADVELQLSLLSKSSKIAPNALK